MQERLTGELEGGNCIYILMGFRVCHLVILNILSLRSLRKWQKQGGLSDLSLCHSPLKQVLRPSCDGCLPCNRKGKKDSYLQD